MRPERRSLRTDGSHRPCLAMTDEVMPIDRRAFSFLHRSGSLRRNRPDTLSGQVPKGDPAPMVGR
jgi:hypothetical protein